MDSLVTPDWLATNFGAPGLHIVDATLLDPSLGRDARAEYDAGHIPGAVFLDLASLRDTASPFPNTLPGPDTLAARLRALGIGDGARVVLYDDSPWHSAARAWWLLKSYGIGDVAILDGGLSGWRAAGHPLDTAPPSPRAAEPPPAPAPDFNPARLRTIDQMRANLSTQAEQVVDARSLARFSGDEADPHGAAPGHIPGSTNLHYARLFDGEGRWKRSEALAAAFAQGHVDLDRPTVATCGSGVTAAVLAFGAHLLGREMAIYDGSWSEWGRDPSTPKELGA
ncbi:sulfurtransferase [Sphingomonas rubra]|uniref:Thiosulfate/3-mercaptopyruvate sulfurtransferase n=1 Tax=Sphingomonas rubra TaxID=634430 RepID=A0A1I5U1W3_9SPHN|nr:sulfurtransferase [Sphingomonas rubra]SFP89288.1 thiosulfate/3-mercaptopyruvate sulfurtransferase [Sphingomonas rubra]